MRVAVIDVGASSVRLLVAERRAAGVTPLHEEKQRLHLGRDIERHGGISPRKVERAADAVAEQVATARSLGVEHVSVLVTAPGRQSSNAAAFLHELERAAGSAARVLTPAEEARLAFRGATSAYGPHGGALCVCDVGGASTELAVGRPGFRATWVRSVEIGAVRLAERFGDDAGAEAEAARYFERVHPPSAVGALVTGGTARAVAKLVGPVLGPGELAIARRLARQSPEAIAARYGIRKGRARTLGAGIAVLRALQARLGLPLEVCAHGLREGAALTALHERAA